MGADDLYEQAANMEKVLRWVTQNVQPVYESYLEFWNALQKMPGLDIKISPFEYTDCPTKPAPLDYIMEKFRGGGLVLIQTGAFWHRISKCEGVGSAINMEAEALNNGKVFKILNPKVKVTRIAFASKSGA